MDHALTPETTPAAAEDLAQNGADPVLCERSPLGEFSLMLGERAVDALRALAQEHRLALYRLLVQAGDEGLAAGTIAEKLALPNSSLSFHLAQLRNTGLIVQERRHRSIIYRANYEAMNALVAFLTENCCGGGECTTAPVGEPETEQRKSA